MIISFYCLYLLIWQIPVLTILIPLIVIETSKAIARTIRKVSIKLIPDKLCESPPPPGTDLGVFGTPLSRIFQRVFDTSRLNLFTEILPESWKIYGIKFWPFRFLTSLSLYLWAILVPHFFLSTGCFLSCYLVSGNHLEMKFSLIKWLDWIWNPNVFSLAKVDTSFKPSKIY